MSKFAMEVVYTRTYTTNYVIEAEDETDAQHIAEGLIDDYKFLCDAANALNEFDFTYELGEVVPVCDDCEVGEFFHE